MSMPEIGRAVLAEGFERIGDRNGDLVALHHDLATGDGHIVGKQPDFVLGMAVEFDDGAASHLQKLMDRQVGPAEHDGDFDKDVVDGVHFYPQLAITRLQHS